MPTPPGGLLGPLVAASDRLRHDPADLRARAEDLLSRPPYTEAEPGILSRAMQWLGEAVARVLQAIADGIGATGSVGAWSIVVVGTALLVLVVWRLTRGATLDRRSPEIPAAPPSRSASSWASEARDHHAAGRLREAVRCWYVALAVGLVEQGVVEETPGRTVRELDAEVARNAPGLAEDVARAGATFEAIVYGNERPDEASVERVRTAAQRPQLVRG